MPVGWTFAGEPPSLRSPGGTVTLVEGAGFCFCGRTGDIAPDQPHGLFFRDSRLLSQWQLLAPGGVPARLGPRGRPHGVTGVICDDPPELPDAITAARRLSPAACREHVRSRCDVETMVTGYEQLYRGAILDRLPVRPDNLVRPAVRRCGRTPAAA